MEAINTVKFLESRSGEIHTMIRLLRESRGFKRAFQTLPRFLRRRSASHNIKRLPRRIRGRHLDETSRSNLNSDNNGITKPKKRSNHSRRTVARRLKLLGLSSSVVPTHDGKETAVNTRVARLPTHIWFAKRAKMVEKWGYMVVQTPSIKCHRMVTKAATRGGSVAWDLSFYSTVCLKGSRVDVESVLKAISSWKRSLQAKSKGEGGEYLAWEGWLHTALGGGQRKPLAPAMILFKSLPGSDGQEEQAETLLRFHPSYYSTVWAEVHKHTTPRPSLTLSDLRSKLGSFQLIGPASGAVLNSLLTGKTTHKFTSPFDCQPGSAFSLHLPGPHPKSPGFPIFLIPQNTRGFQLNRKPSCPASDSRGYGALLQSWTIILPLRFAKDVWLSLIRSISGNTTQSTQFAGWQEYCNLYRECGGEVMFDESPVNSKAWTEEEREIVPPHLVLRNPLGARGKVTFDGRFLSAEGKKCLPIHILIDHRIKKAESDRLVESETALKQYFCFTPKSKGLAMNTAGVVLDMDRPYFSLKEGTELFLGLLFCEEGIEAQMMEASNSKVLVKLGDRGWRQGRWRFCAL